MNGILRVPRSRGVLSGLLLVVLGAWGALVPFVGPYFHYAYTPDKAWTYTTGRLWLEILPGAAALLGGLVLLASSSRPAAHAGAWLAALGGAWFVLGGVIGPTWTGMHMTPGAAAGAPAARALEQIGFFTGLGVVIVLLAAMALGRFSVISVRDPRPAAPATARSRGWRRFVPGRRVTSTEQTGEPAAQRVTATELTAAPGARATPPSPPSRPRPHSQQA